MINKNFVDFVAKKAFSNEAKTLRDANVKLGDALYAELYTNKMHEFNGTRLMLRSEITVYTKEKEQCTFNLSKERYIDSNDGIERLTVDKSRDSEIKDYQYAEDQFYAYVQGFSEGLEKLLNFVDDFDELVKFVPKLKPYVYEFIRSNKDRINQIILDVESTLTGEIGERMMCSHLHIADPKVPVSMSAFKY